MPTMATRHASFTLGIMLAFGGMQFVENAPDPRSAAITLASLAVLATSLVLLVPPAFVRERQEYQGRGAQNSFRAMADVLRNPHARLLLIVVFIEMSGAGVLGILSPYLVVYILKRPDLIGPIAPPQPEEIPAKTSRTPIKTTSPSPIKKQEPKERDMPTMATRHTSRFPKRREARIQNGIEARLATTKTAGSGPIRSGRLRMYTTR